MSRSVWETRSHSPSSKPVKNGKGTGEGLKVIGSSNCWCGKNRGHDGPHTKEGHGNKGTA